MNVIEVDNSAIPLVDLAATGYNIKNLRISAGISVKNLQNISGFTNLKSICERQNCDSMPSIDNLIILATVLGVTVDEIIVIKYDAHCDDEL